MWLERASPVLASRTMTDAKDSEVDSQTEPTEHEASDVEIVVPAEPAEERRAEGFGFRSGIIRLPGSLAEQALLLGLIAMLFPAVNFSLSPGGPEEATNLVVAICVALFATVTYLWILDATNVLRFREKWVSQTVYGAVITSVLGTSAAVYSSALRDNSGPQYNGAWDLRLVQDGAVIAAHHVLLVFSKNSESYWGRSDVISGDSCRAALDEPEGRFCFVYIDDFAPSGTTASAALRFRRGTDEAAFTVSFTSDRDGVSWKGEGGGYSIDLVRSK